MAVLFSTGLEVLAAAFVLVPIYMILGKLYFRSWKISVVYCVFSLYLAAVYILVGLPNITYIRLDFTVNLVPFADFLAGWRSSILNILLFVPLGFLLPLIWRQYKDGKHTILFGFFLSLAIEILQTFTYRATDVNDLMTNTFGTFLGYAIAHAINQWIPAIERIGGMRKTSELHLVCAVTFAVMFFVQPFLSAIAWAII